MWSGSSALKNIDQTLQTIRNDVVRLDSQLSQLTDAITTQQRQRLKIINDIAAVRLVEIERGGLLSQLTAADAQAQEIMRTRESALEVLNLNIDKQNEEISAAESQREGLLSKLNAHSQSMVDAETSVQLALKSDAAFIELFGQASKADSIAREAAQKVESAQADMAEKAKPYEEDKLFMYLWQRGYGTTQYKGRLFSRMMDSWVAGIVGYERARVNFWNLTEIPKRLEEHASSAQDAADESKMNLQQLELDALAAAGVPEMEDALEKLREAMDSHDDQLESSENALNSSLATRATFVAGEDDYIKRSVERLSQAINHQGLNSIHRYVRDTTSPTDDQLVIELQRVEDSVQRGKGDLGSIRKLHNNKLNKLKELEQVRRNFKDSRFDDVRSGFGNESLLAGILGQFLQGVVSGSDVWRTIKRNQRYRDTGSQPDFGSGGLGTLGDLLGGGNVGRQSRTGSTWHWPKPRRGGGGFNFPRGGGGGRRGGGGGFRTGGGV